MASALKKRLTVLITKLLGCCTVTSAGESFHHLNAQTLAPVLEDLKKVLSLCNLSRRSAWKTRIFWESEPSESPSVPSGSPRFPRLVIQHVESEGVFLLTPHCTFMALFKVRSRVTFISSTAPFLRLSLPRCHASAVFSNVCRFEDACLQLLGSVEIKPITVLLWSWATEMF